MYKYTPCYCTRNSPPDRSAPKESAVSQVSGVGENVAGFFFGRGFTSAASRSGSRSLWRQRRTPTTLALVDTRTDEEVIITSDNAFGDPFMIAALLKQYAADKQQIYN